MSRPSHHPHRLHQERSSDHELFVSRIKERESGTGQQNGRESDRCVIMTMMMMGSRKGERVGEGEEGRESEREAEE